MSKRYRGIWKLASGDITELVFIKKVRWVAKGATLGDQCVLKDNNGEILWESVATYVNWTDSSDLNRLVAVTVATLSSGTLYLYE